MFFTFSLLIVYSLVQFVRGASNPSVRSTSFCYDQAQCGQTHWGGLCQTGQSQSPIDIELKTYKSYFAAPTSFSLNNHYATESVKKFYGQNNGHTVQFDFTPNLAELTSNLEIGNGGLATTYKFAQLHFHWSQNVHHGSEHTINGNAYPMELHIVHFKSHYASLDDALKHDEPDVVAVMAIFLKVSLFPNSAIQPIVQALDKLEDPGVLTQFNLTLRISDLYPKKMEFARYSGSLTTPNCDEKVIWTVFLRPVSISAEQIATFRHLTNELHISSFNYRETQPINHRQILFYKGSFSFQEIPSFFSPISHLLGIVYHFIRKILHYFIPFLGR